jgi:putative flippase GtrA
MDKIRACLKSFFDATFLRFVIVGVMNTLFGSGVMFLLYNLLLYPYRWGYWVSSAANYVFGSILSYVLNKRFTFRNTEKGIGPVLRFAVNIAACYFIAYGLAKPAVRLLLSGSGQRVQENAAMLAGMALFVLLNYLGQRFFAFKKPK